MTVRAFHSRLADRVGRRHLSGAALVLLAACGHQEDKVESTPPPMAAPATPLATPGLGPQRRYQLALQLLQQGRTAEARVELAQIQLDRTGDRRSAMLLREIDTDPQALYGADSFAYVVQPGDTLFSLARKYLHDPMNFLGLARFNHIMLPVDLQPGQSIFIPGHPRAPAREVAAPRRAASPPPGATTAEEPARATPSPPEPARREEAQRLRREGLEQMSAGSIDRAVTLLSQAATLDPENGAIGADLARARRIQATVHSK